MAESGKPEERPEQDSADGVALGGSDDRPHAVEHQPHGGMIGEAGIGCVVGDAAPFQAAGEFGEDVALAAHQHRHAAIGDAVTEMHPLHLGGDPLGLVGQLVEPVHLHRPLALGGDDRTRRTGEIATGGDPDGRRRGSRQAPGTKW